MLIRILSCVGENSSTLKESVLSERQFEEEVRLENVERDHSKAAVLECRISKTREEQFRKLNYGQRLCFDTFSIWYKRPKDDPGKINKALFAINCEA